jgi:hypothetical protein
MKQFIPFDDDWFEHPEAMPGPLVPFQIDMPCYRSMDDHAQCTGPMGPFSEKRSPTSSPS